MTICNENSVLSPKQKLNFDAGKLLKISTLYIAIVRWGLDNDRWERDRPGVGEAGGRVYVVGGSSGRALVKDVECWEGGTWQKIASMNVARQVVFSWLKTARGLL